MTEIKKFFTREDVKKRFKELLQDKSEAFITSLLQVISQDKNLILCDVKSIYNAGIMSAMLDLPIAKGFGFSFIVPYNDKSKGWLAQFQVGYKGYLQLAQRSNFFKTINVTPIYEGQLVEFNPLDGHIFDLRLNSRTSDEIIGYAAKFILLNGFEAINYMSVSDIKVHSEKYSDSYRTGKGFWFDNFDSMACKTTLKLLLSKQAPLSTDMQKAILIDQSVIQDVENMDVDYVDNKSQKLTMEINKEEERLILMMYDCKNLKELVPLKKFAKTDKLKSEYKLIYTGLTGG
jgi:recombination protein RecT